jgi:hypothetical protein
VLVLLVLAAACGKDAKDAPRREPPAKAPETPPIVVDAAPVMPKADAYPDLGAALEAIVPANARVIGFGELHARTDRAQVKSALARFTADGLPAIADNLSDLVVETWIVDPKCGQAAKTATAKVEITVRRPQETKSEIALLAEAARAKQVQPHAMKLTCEDYERIAPSGKDAKPEEMLTLTTRELGRISGEAIRHRGKEGNKKPWIAVYGGALHNDLAPAKGVEDWSYAAKVDAEVPNGFVEIDLIVPELAEPDAGSQKEPWFPLVSSDEPTVRVWKRGDRSFVIVFPRTK